MYQYVEEQRRKELKELKEAEEEVVQEFDKVKRKLKCIAEYKSLKDDQCGLLTLISVVTILVVQIITGCICMGMIASKYNLFLGNSLALESLHFSLSFGCIGLCCSVLGYAGGKVISFQENSKKIKSLRLEGVEEFIKQEELLKKREAQLGIEKENIQSEIEEVNTDLNCITFFKNNIYCLADTREEYEFLINEQEKATSSLEEFLNELIKNAEVNEYDENIHNSCGKSLSKKF